MASCAYSSLRAQQKVISGKVIDSLSRQPIAGVTVMLNPGNIYTATKENGVYSFKNIGLNVRSLSFSAIGYKKCSVSLEKLSNDMPIVLSPAQTHLEEVKISGNNDNPYKAISETDISLRGVSNSQEVLRIVPGLFIGQHQGGGKAEQIFLRGFDNDHGTNLNMSVDGLPINMVSQAHGQGYADSHFIIPETIESTNYQKGMYNAEKGDLAVTGYVGFNTANSISANTFKLEAGQFNTFRVLGMLNLLGERAKVKGQSWYAASEYRYSDSYFDNSQKFKRFNFFTKYHASLGNHNALSLSASTLYSSWEASGQIPESAVDDGTIGFYGAIDPNEGGITSRTNFNAQLLTTEANGDIFKNQLFYSRYKFDLHTNFTFFLEDPVNGDEIRQRESRNLFGYTGSYQHADYLGKIKLATELGLSARLDATKGSELSHTINNFTLINPVKLGDITELGMGAYISERVQFSQRFSINAGLRFDQFYYRYDNQYAGDATLNGIGIYRAKNNIISPKLNFYYQVSENTQLYLLSGKSFHSNDARVVVAAQGLKTLPAAYGVDLGTVLKPVNNLLLNTAIWYSYLQNEYVYSGDGGTVDFSGRTRRIGVDFSGRYQPFKSLYFDGDINYAYGRSIDDPRGANYIPLAPVWSSTGGMTYIFNEGFNGSFRYRYLSDRAANSDYSLKAEGYFVNDLVINYSTAKYEFGITINNIFNVRWKETQFETETRLQNQNAVNGIAFTPGTKFAAVAHVSYFFK